MATRFLALVLSLVFLSSCEAYRDFDHMELVTNSFTGTMSVAETVGDVEGIYSGSNDSGAYAFIWDNPAEGAILNVNVSGEEGTVQFMLEDSRGNEVLNAYTSGESSLFLVQGRRGKWNVRVVFSEFEGDGSFDLSPVN